MSVTATDKDGGVSTAATSVITISPPLERQRGEQFQHQRGEQLHLPWHGHGRDSPYTYSWNFGDGDTGDRRKPEPHVHGRSAHLHGGPDGHDSAGHSGSASVAATVVNVAPTATESGPTSGTTGTALSFTASATDPSTVDTAAGFTYNWNFGDGRHGHRRESRATPTRPPARTP